jgi:hypothetical protein
VTSPPIARRPMTRIVMPWRVRRWAAFADVQIGNV